MEKQFDDNDIVIIDAGRSIIGSTSGTLKDLNAADLSSYIVEGLLTRLEKKSSLFSRNEIQQLIVGLCIGSGMGQNLPRQIGHKCKMNLIESAFVINEMCGSGLESIILGMQSLMLNEYKMVLTGGVEAPSASPYFITEKQLISWAELTVEEIQTKVVKSDMHDALWCKMFNVHTIFHAENTTAEWVRKKGYNPVSFKKEIDDYAILSNKRAVNAAAEGVFQDEIIHIPDASHRDEIPKLRKPETFYKRAGTQFTPNGIFLSNHNSPPIANGAAYLLLMKAGDARGYKLKPMARISGYGKAAVIPEKFLLAPVSAVKNLLKRTDTKIWDYDLFEMNTSFGSQMLINKEELNLDMKKVNIYGDCIAFGHPIGGAGGRLITTLLYALKRKKLKTGLAAICLGGGNAIAMGIESLTVL